MYRLLWDPREKHFTYLRGWLQEGINYVNEDMKFSYLEMGMERVIKLFKLGNSVS